ncbi:MAG: two-component sensor histidine kinase, partial [Cellulomonadaceae bacterium]|nr:two-component sensor histidine kinase [Cellulomonadaceae bacterium]
MTPALARFPTYRAAFARLIRPIAHKMHTSMQVRIVAIAMGIGILTVTVAGAFLSLTIRDGLFHKRVAQLDQEYARTASVARETFAASQATSAADLQAQMINLVTERIGQGHSVARGSMLASVESAPVGVNDTATFEAMFDIVSPQLREAAIDSYQAVWQSVEIPAAFSQSGDDEPGVVFASLVDMPAYGRFGLFVLYSMEPEQATLNLVERTLALGAMVI